MKKILSALAFLILATAAQSVDLRISWGDLSDDETGFELRRKIGAGEWEPVVITEANETFVIDLDLQETETITYRVRAINDNGASGWQEGSISFGVPNMPGAIGITIEPETP